MFNLADLVPPPPFAALPNPVAVARRLAGAAVRGAGLVPFAIQRGALMPVMEQALSEPMEEGDLAFLRGKWLEVDIRDAGLRWFFSCASDGRLVLADSARSDVAIRGNLKEFVLLAARAEDPDTLFFQRRLVIEGDTELGLEVKNMMDAVDHDSLSPLLRLALARAAGLVSFLL